MALIDALVLTLVSAPILYLWVVRPVVIQRDAAEKARRETARGAEEADRARSEFLARMSHEIRTPLNAILGFSEIIKNETMGPVGTPKYAEYARDIHASAMHVLGLVNDILDLSKIEAGRFELHEEVFEVREIVGEAVDLLALMSREKGLALTTDLPADLPRLSADRQAVRQMLINLLSNAIKFTPEGGAVTVRASADGDGLTLAVSDTGIGIDPKDLETVLSPFGQVAGRNARSREGTGLGLSLVKSMIELHGGRLAIDSAPGEGTTAALHFPPQRVRPPPQATA